MADRISHLPDDLLRLVLLRLACARAAARTTVLSRRWRAVYSSLPEADVTLHHVPLGSLQPALRRAAGPRVRTLDICVPGGPQGRRTSTRFSSVLRAAADLAPADLRFDLTRYPACAPGPFVVELPLFLPLLERLTVSGCKLDLAAVAPCCPRLRVLTVDDFTVHSASMQELLAGRIKASSSWKGRRLDAGKLKLWTTESLYNAGEVKSTILAPMVDKVSSKCSYPKLDHGVGLWGLSELCLESPERRGVGVIPRVEVLSLDMCAQGSLSFQGGFAAEINKHLETRFSTLNLHLTTRGHAFGSLVLRLLGMHRLTDVRNLNIVLLTSEVEEACPPNCPCDDPKCWRTQIVSWNLEKVEIKGFGGEDHEFDFLRVVFRCSPMLKSVSIRMSDQDM